MVKASSGLRTGTRRKLKKGYRDKFTVTPFLRELTEGQNVIENPNPASHNGMPHIRFKGASGVIRGKRGDAYIVDVKIGNKTKTINARPEHMKPAQGV